MVGQNLASVYGKGWIEEQPFMETADIKTALDGARSIENNQEPSFIRLWKWLDRGNNHL
ncbi:hypothetical protein [Microcoleus sp. OTE_8_concoct_300]|uniref:hypothetical protein n=1 Tax=Microcoleus sp. OTE_8_concoct_300 TaxID=2964710 RepID=UPI00403F2F64